MDRILFYLFIYLFLIHCAQEKKKKKKKEKEKRKKERKKRKEKKRKEKKKLQRQRLLSLYPKFEHSKLEIQDVEFNKNGEVQFKHWSEFVPTHSEHP